MLLADQGQSWKEAVVTVDAWREGTVKASCVSDYPSMGLGHLSGAVTRAGGSQVQHPLQSCVLPAVRAAPQVPGWRPHPVPIECHPAAPGPFIG